MIAHIAARAIASIETGRRHRVHMPPARLENTMEETQKLTAANIRYLLTIKAFTDENKPIRNKYLADFFHYKKSSIHSMLKSLVSIGMITIDDGNIIYLTEKGADTAQRYQEYYSRLDKMMQKCFPELDENENAILALLAEIPEHILHKILDKHSIL